MARLKRIVVDREAIAAEFLARLSQEGRAIVTVLRTDQYAGLESFHQVREVERESARCMNGHSLKDKERGINS